MNFNSCTTEEIRETPSLEVLEVRKSNVYIYALVIYKERIKGCLVFHRSQVIDTYNFINERQMNAFWARLQNISHPWQLMTPDEEVVHHAGVEQIQHKFPWLKAKENGNHT